MMKRLADTLAYWFKPNDLPNEAESYLLGREKSYYLLRLMAQVPYDWTVLELGCNVGRNLNVLHQEGYRNICGIDISERAIAVGRKTFPDIAPFMYQEEMADWAGSGSQHDLIFTMAVLAHLHPDQEFVLSAIGARATGMIITIENEQTRDGKHEPRNYRQVFEPLGWHQTFMEVPDQLPFFDEKFRTRVFEKR